MIFSPPPFPLQNMLFEIEQKVAFLSELSVHSESLLLEGRAETKGEAEQLTFKLRSLKDSLMELQQMLQDKQVDIQVKSGRRQRSLASRATTTPRSVCPSLSPHPHHLSLRRSCCILRPFVKRINGSIVRTAKVMSRPFVSRPYPTMEQQAPVSLTMALKTTNKRMLAHHKLALDILLQM